MNDILAEMRFKMEALKNKKRILVTGRAIPQQPDRCTGQQLTHGFKEAGHEAYFFGCFYGQPMNFIGSKECQSMDKWDLVVVTEMNDGMPGYEPLFQYHKLKDVPKLYWDFDISYNEPFAWQRAGSHPYDGYLVGNKLYVERFADKFKKPSLHLPYACSPIIHRRIDGTLRNNIVGFVGNMTPERAMLLRNVHCVQGVFGDDLIKATNQLYTMVHINQNACKGLVPGRPWETAGCGVNLLMDRSSYEDFKEFIPEYLDGFAVRPFDDAEDIQKYIRDNQDNLQSLDKSGRLLMEYIHREHSYKNRAETILQWAKEQGLLK
jgi:hypothetical protein